MGCIAITLIPLQLYGRDLYSLLAIIFGLRYVGVALIAKTAYGQMLEENLYAPLASYSLTLLLMAVEVGLLLIARGFDRGTTLFPFSMDPIGLRRLSIISIGIGLAGEAIVGANKSFESGALNAGALFIIAAHAADFFFLGLIAEVMHNIIKSDRRTFIGPLLGAWITLALLIAIALNVREFFVSGMIAVVATAFIYKMIRFHHIVIGLLAAASFIYILTPITFYLRSAKEGLDIVRYLDLAQSTILRAATEPAFFNEIANQSKRVESLDANDPVSYDYYGNRATVLNRVSYVALLDAVYNGTHSRVPIGMPAVDQLIARVAPGFLGYDKNITRYGLGDWFSWQTGLTEPKSIIFANFGLPMEALASWGLIGFVTYPLLFGFPLLFLWSHLSSFRVPTAASLFIFANIHHQLIESNSDGFVTMLTRGVPFTAISLFLLYKFVSMYSPESGMTRSLHRP